MDWPDQWGICSLPPLSSFSQLRLGMNASHCLMASQIFMENCHSQNVLFNGVIQSRRHKPLSQLYCTLDLHFSASKTGWKTRAHGRSYVSPRAGNRSFAQAPAKSESNRSHVASYFSLCKTPLPKRSGERDVMCGWLRRAEPAPPQPLCNRPLPRSPGHAAKDTCKSRPSPFHLSCS